MGSAGLPRRAVLEQRREEEEHELAGRRIPGPGPHLRQSCLRQGRHQGDQGSKASCWPKAYADNHQWLLPLFAALISENELLSRHLTLPTHARSDSTESNGGSEKPSNKRPSDLVVTLTIAASAALGIYVTSTTSALGISSAIFAATGLVLFEIAVRGTKDDNDGGPRGLMSADGSFSRRGSVSSTRKANEFAALRDVAAAMTVMCGIAVYMAEPSVAPGAATWEPLYRDFDRDWKTVHDYRTVRQVFFMIIVNVALNLFTFLIVSPPSPHTHATLSTAHALYAPLHSPAKHSPKTT